MSVLKEVRLGCWCGGHVYPRRESCSVEPGYYKAGHDPRAIETLVSCSVVRVAKKRRNMGFARRLCCGCRRCALVACIPGVREWSRSFASVALRAV